MAKKKRPDTPSKPPQFHTTPFSSLKGVVAAMPPPSTEPPAAVPVPVPHEEDGAALFLQAMDDVRKLGGPRQGSATDAPSRHRRPAPSAGTMPPPPAPQDRAAAELFLQEIGRLKLEVRFTETAPDEDELKPMSGNRLRQLKRGIITVDRQLDLHGLTRDEALTELPRFLRNAQHKGCVAVLVITGKGYNSPGEPVLQHAVTSWLRDAGREMVIEYAPSPREMGGSGAFIVFLRTMPKAADASS